MVCPSCGHEVEATETACSCGAQWVGQPPTESIHPVPRLIYGLAALLLVGGTLIFQLVITVRSLYLSDLRWEWELFLTTSYLAWFTLPITLLATYVAWRGTRLANQQPREFGGAWLSQRCLAASLLLCLLNGGTLAARLPDLIENWQFKRQARTRATLYKLNNLISQYREQYGFYPERLIDLQEMDSTLRPLLDSWDHPFVYTPMSAQVAFRGLPAPFQNYELVSRGADGIMGTADDVVMRDGMILMAPTRTDEDHEENHPQASPKDAP